MRYKTSALEEWVMHLINKDYHNISLLESQARYFQINISHSVAIVSIKINDFNNNIFDYELLQKNETIIISLLKLYFPQAYFQMYISNGLFILSIPINNKSNIKEFKFVFTFH